LGAQAVTAHACKQRKSEAGSLIDGLQGQLKDELPGILNWTLFGLEEWQKMVCKNLRRSLMKAMIIERNWILFLSSL
tara:strand:- start:285 stop:515 length:231 start_codon:yes stop_codon:yes gene_type:complete